MESMDKLNTLLTPYANGKGKERLSAKQIRKLQSIKAMRRNVYDDGYIGGDRGVSPKGIQNAIGFLESL